MFSTIHLVEFLLTKLHLNLFSTYKTDKHAEFLRPFMSVQLSISRIQLLVPKQVYISYICSKYIL